jgi:hypothetical protein
MKYIAALTCLLLVSIAPAAFAVPSNDCAARSEKVAVTEKDDFLKACLAEASAPSKVKEAKHSHKKARCEQNAKNMKLQGDEKGKYQAECINKNQAVVAANSISKTGAETAEKPAADKPAVKKHAAKKHKEKKKNSGKVVKLSPPASGVAATK